MSTTMTNPDQKIMGKVQHDIDQTWKGVYRIGGLSLALGGFLYLLATPLGYYLGTPPGNSLAYLQSLASHPTVAQVTYWLFLLAAIAFIPGTLGLYLSLKSVNKNAMLIAASLLFFFIILDVVISELNALVLVALTKSYAAATTDVLRVAYQAAAAWGLATLPIGTFFSWIGPCIGYLITAIVMLKSAFGRNTAIFGMIVNSAAIICGIYFLHPIPILLFLQTPVLLLYGAWLMVSGFKLFKF